MKSEAGLDEEGRVNLNTAPRKRLASLPGVSSSLAKKIISNRPIESRGDLIRLGLPPSALDNLRPHIVPLPASSALRTAQQATSTMAHMGHMGNMGHMNHMGHVGHMGHMGHMGHGNGNSNHPMHKEKKHP